MATAGRAPRGPIIIYSIKAHSYVAKVEGGRWKVGGGASNGINKSHKVLIYIPEVTPSVDLDPRMHLLANYLVRKPHLHFHSKREDYMDRLIITRAGWQLVDIMEL